MLPELQHKIITAVLAQNPETGEIAYKEVLDTFRNETNVVVHVTVNDETFTCTEEHPFYVEGKGWVNASALHAGMVVWLADGTKAIIEDVTIEYLDTPIAVYNFKVEDFHTYFVGYSGVLVHNSECGTTVVESSTTQWQRMTSKESAQAAKNLGFEKTNYRAKNGEPIYYNKKTKTYISQDIGSGDGSGPHNGGVWKQAKSPEALNSKKTRLGTYDANLNRIGD